MFHQVKRLRFPFTGNRNLYFSSLSLSSHHLGYAEYIAATFSVGAIKINLSIEKHGTQTSQEEAGIITFTKFLNIEKIIKHYILITFGHKYA